MFDRCLGRVLNIYILCEKMPNGRRIFFIDGVQCCGKTTILRHIAEKYSDVAVPLFLDYAQFNLIQSRTKPSSSPPPPSIMTKNQIAVYQMWYMSEMLAALNNHNDSKKMLVVDRSPLAPHIYRWIFGDYTHEEIGLTLTRMLDMGTIDAKTSNYIFVLPDVKMIDAMPHHMTARACSVDVIDRQVINKSIEVFELVCSILKQSSCTNVDIYRMNFHDFNVEDFCRDYFFNK